MNAAEQELPAASGETASSAESDVKTKPPDSEWRKKLMSAMKNPEALAALSQTAREQNISSALTYPSLTRRTGSYTAFDYKMRQAGEDDE